MRISYPIRLTPSEKTQLIIWSSSAPPGSGLARNSTIILELAEDWMVTQVAEMLGFCRQTISEVRNLFLIFRLDGIRISISKPGRRPLNRSEKADENLHTPLPELSEKTPRRTGPQLSKRCEQPLSTTSRFLMEHDIDNKDPRAIEYGIKGYDARIMELGGLFLSPSIRVFALCCGGETQTALADGPTSVTVHPTEGAQTAITNESKELIQLLTELQKDCLSVHSKASERRYLLRFLEILDKRIDVREAALLIADIPKGDLIDSVRRWLERHLRFHLVILPGFDRWSEGLRESLKCVKGPDIKTIVFQLEYLILTLKNWRAGPYWKLGVYASFAPLRSGLH